MNNRIGEMERRLEQITSATAELQEKLSAIRSLEKDTKALYSYYGTEDWYKDREEHSAVKDQDTAPKAGVLSEDLIYDSITKLRDTAFTMLELGTEILKDWI